MAEEAHAVNSRAEATLKWQKGKKTVRNQTPTRLTTNRRDTTITKQVDEQTSQ